MDVSAVGRKIRELRETQFLSVAELAGKAGVTPETVKRIEDAKNTNPRFGTLRKIAAALEVHPSKLVA